VIFARQFMSPLIYILVAAAGVTAVLREWIDTGIIVAVVLLNAIIGLVQESGAERAVRSLSALLSHKAAVIRDGQLLHIESRLLVPGDRVFLESGVRVAADIRLFSAHNLLIDEAILTGESTAALKQAGIAPAEAPLADLFNMAHAGTVVRSGRAMGVVVATGAATAVGQIAETMRREQTPQTPLQDRLTRLAKMIGIGVAAVSLLSFGIGTLQGNAGSEMLKVASHWPSQRPRRDCRLPLRSRLRSASGGWRTAKQSFGTSRRSKRSAAPPSSAPIKQGRSPRTR